MNKGSSSIMSNPWFFLNVGNSQGTRSLHLTKLNTETSENVVSKYVGEDNDQSWAIIAPLNPDYTGSYNIINKGSEVALSYNPVTFGVEAKELDRHDAGFVWKLAKVNIGPDPSQQPGSPRIVGGPFKEVWSIIPYLFENYRLTGGENNAPITIQPLKAEATKPYINYFQRWRLVDI
ncbi:hypothetical protein G9A89_005034 [Geosiphon pyriformis]|nr:hypothetical protein G9A89_005034 [Geosiphon pyriformis]